MLSEFVIRTLVVGLLFGATILATTDYCKLNCDSTKNIGCDNKKAISSNCTNGTLYEYSSDDIKYWLTLVNEGRNQTANGSLSGLETASAMVRASWSPELANQSCFNAQTCKYGHDQCHKTALYNYTGQNIGQVSYSAKYYAPKEAIKMIYDMWFVEYRNTTMKAINSYPKDSKVVIGHYTQLARDISPEFGCCASKFKSGKMYNWYIVCDYATTNIINKPIYKTGKPCSACKSGCDKDFKALCTTKEKVNANSF